MLQAYGVMAPEDLPAVPADVFEAGSSKLKLWVCGCQPEPVRLRVAVADLRAMCLKCGCLFVKKKRSADQT